MPLAHAFGAAWVAPDDALNVQGQRAIAALGCRMHLAVSAGKSGAARWFPGRLADPVPRKFGLHAFYCVNAVFSVFAVEVENVDAGLLTRRKR